MKWFIVALVTFSSTGEQDIKYHQQLSFDSYVECDSFWQEYSKSLLQGLKRVYPDIERATVQCLNTKTMLSMQRALKNEGSPK